MSHHGNNPDNEELLKSAFKKMFGEFPDGRLNPHDEGAIPVMLGHENGRVVMQFPRNLNFIGFTPDQAIGIAEILIQHARTCGSAKPLTVKVG
jgi:hypothetical protein